MVSKPIMPEECRQRIFAEFVCEAVTYITSLLKSGSEWEYDTLRRRETWDFAQLTLHLYIINWRNVKRITLILAAIIYRRCLLLVWNCWWPTLLYSLWVKYQSLYFKQTTWKFQLHALLDARLDVNNREAPTWQSKVRIIYLPLHLSQQ